MGRPLGIDGPGADAGNGVRRLLEGPVQIPAAEIEAVPAHCGQLDGVLNGIGLGNGAQFLRRQVLISKLVNHRRPDRVQRHHIPVRIGQCHALLLIGVLRGTAVRIGCPALEGIARPGKGIASQRIGLAADHSLGLHSPLVRAIAVVDHGVAAGSPLGIEGDLRSLARGDGIDDLPASLIQTPAQETEAGLPGRLQDQRLIGAPSGGIGVLDALHILIGQNIGSGHTVHDLLCRGGPLSLFIQEELAAGIALPVLKPAVFPLGRGLCGVMGQNMTGNPRHFAPNGGPAVAAGGLRGPIAGVDTDDVVFQAHESIGFELGHIFAGEDDGWVLLPRTVHLAESLVSDVGHRGGQTNAFHRLVVPEEALRNVRDSLRKFNMIDKFAGKPIAAKLRDGILNDHVLNADPEGQLLLGVIRHFSGTCQRQGTDPQGTDSALGDPEGRGHGQRVQIAAGPDGRFSKGDLIGEDRQLFQIAPAERVAANRFHIGAERQLFQSGTEESAILNGLQGIRERSGFQALAAVEGVLPDFLQGIAKGNVLQVLAAAEGGSSDLFQCGRELYAFECFTVTEHSLGELCDFIGQSDALQRIAAGKRPVSYLLNGIGEGNTFRIGKAFKRRVGQPQNGRGQPDAAHLIGNGRKGGLVIAVGLQERNAGGNRQSAVFRKRPVMIVRRGNNVSVACQALSIAQRTRIADAFIYMDTLPALRTPEEIASRTVRHVVGDLLVPGCVQIVVLTVHPDDIPGVLHGIAVDIAGVNAARQRQPVESQGVAHTHGGILHQRRIGGVLLHIRCIVQILVVVPDMVDHIIVDGVDLLNIRLAVHIQFLKDLVDLGVHCLFLGLGRSVQEVILVGVDVVGLGAAVRHGLLHSVYIAGLGASGIAAHRVVTHDGVAVVLKLVNNIVPEVVANLIFQPDRHSEALLMVVQRFLYGRVEFIPGVAVRRQGTGFGSCRKLRQNLFLGDLPLVQRGDVDLGRGAQVGNAAHILRLIRQNAGAFRDDLQVLPAYNAAENAVPAGFLRRQNLHGLAFNVGPVLVGLLLPAVGKQGVLHNRIVLQKLGTHIVACRAVNDLGVLRLLRDHKPVIGLDFLRLRLSLLCLCSLRNSLGLRGLGLRDLGFRCLGLRDLGFRCLGCFYSRRFRRRLCFSWLRALHGSRDLRGGLTGLAILGRIRPDTGREHPHTHRQRQQERKQTLHSYSSISLCIVLHSIIIA